MPDACYGALSMLISLPRATIDAAIDAFGETQTPLR